MQEFSKYEVLNLELIDSCDLAPAVEEARAQYVPSRYRRALYFVFGAFRPVRERLREEE